MRARPDLIFGHPASKLSPHPLGLAQTLALGRDGKLLSEWTKQVGLPPRALTSTAGRDGGAVLDCRGQRLSWMEVR